MNPICREVKLLDLFQLNHYLMGLPQVRMAGPPWLGYFLPGLDTFF